MASPDAPRCPLCNGDRVPRLLEDAHRVYRQCGDCDLIFLDPAGYLTPLGEILRYLEHDNRRDDPAYEQFLRRLGDQVEARLDAGSAGLDFGCGPVPVLGEWLGAQGLPTASYDPLFHPDEALLRRTYDFVTCSEVVEHAHEPRAMFAQLARLVRPGGMLAVMTRFHGGDAPEAPFDRWWYRRDPTHVCFYSAATMRWIARVRGWTLELPVPNVALFTTDAGDAARSGAPGAQAVGHDDE